MLHKCYWFLRLLLSWLLLWTLLCNWVCWEYPWLGTQHSDLTRLLLDTLSPLSHLLRLPLSDFHSLFLTNDFVWLDFFLISLEYLSGIRLLTAQGRGICSWLLIISLGYDCLGDTGDSVLSCPPWLSRTIRTWAVPWRVGTDRAGVLSYEWYFSMPWIFSIDLR